MNVERACVTACADVPRCTSQRTTSDVPTQAVYLVILGRFSPRPSPLEVLRGWPVRSPDLPVSSPQWIQGRF